MPQNERAQTLTGARRWEVTAEMRGAAAAKLQDWIFLPALLIPATAVVGTLFLSKLHVGAWWLLDSANLTVTSVCLGAVVAVAVALRLTRAPLITPVVEGSRLVQAVGWAIILPQLLAALGGVFSQAGVGPVVAELAARALPTQYPLGAVVAYCGGMARQSSTGSGPLQRSPLGDATASADPPCCGQSCRQEAGA